MWMSGKLPPLTKQTGHTCGEPLLQEKLFNSYLKSFFKGKTLINRQKYSAKKAKYCYIRYIL
jgi:hypothetical protein